MSFGFRSLRSTLIIAHPEYLELMDCPLSQKIITSKEQRLSLFAQIPHYFRSSEIRGLHNRARFRCALDKRITSKRFMGLDCEDSVRRQDNAVSS